MSEHFKLLANENINHEDENIVYDVSNDAILLLNNPITEDEIKMSIRKLNNKSPGNYMI